MSPSNSGATPLGTIGRLTRMETPLDGPVRTAMHLKTMSEFNQKLFLDATMVSVSASKGNDYTSYKKKQLIENKYNVVSCFLRAKVASEAVNPHNLFIWRGAEYRNLKAAALEKKRDEYLQQCLTHMKSWRYLNLVELFKLDKKVLITSRLFWSNEGAFSKKKEKC